jgi:type IV secretory pathway protease TraF
MVAQDAPQLHVGVLGMGQNSSRALLFAMAIALLVATLLVGAIACKPLPLLIWNASDSVPIGWYWVQKRQPKVGEIAVVRSPDWVRLYASSRGYLPEKIWLLKPVFAGSGALVCRVGTFMFVDGKLVARARKFDSQNRILPVWKGCRTLKSDEVFLLAKPRNSFDSRYFGPVNRDVIIGTAVRLRLTLREVQ